MSLRQKAISGVLWTFSQQFGVQLIGFTISLILARLLIPSEFALIAMLSLFVSLGTSIMDSGITASLIRTENPDQGDYSSVFFLNILMGIVIYTILFVCAPLIAKFYHAPLLIDVIRVYSFTFIINSFIGVQSTILTKEMNFKAQLFIQIPATLIAGTCAVFFAYKGFGVWSLVYMNLIQAFVNAFLHWIKSNWYPRFIFNLGKIKHHFKFGYKLLFSSVIDVSIENLYTILIGHFFMPSQLAFYNRAQALQMLPVQNISSALQKVTYPMFAKMQNDSDKLKQTNKLLIIQVIFWIVPIMLVLQLSAQPLIELLLTKKWDGAIIFFKILCFYGLLYPLHIYNLNIIIVKGRTDLFLRLEVIKKVSFIIGVIFAFRFGVVGLAWWQVIFSAVSFFINSYFSGKLISYNFKEQLKDITPIFILGFSIWGLLTVANHYLQSIVMNNVFKIGILGITFFVVYFGFALITKMRAIDDFKYMFLKKQRI